MKLSRIVTVFGIALVGCTGQIDGGGSPGPGTPATPGAPATTPGGVTTTPPAVNAGTCSAATLAAPRAWRLTKAQIKNTLHDVMAFAAPTLDMVPPDGRVDGFANQSDRLVIAPLDADYYFRAGDEIASEVVRRATELVGCPMASLGTGSCLGDFVKRFGAKMWRRPLVDTETAKLSTLFTTTSTMAGGPEAGLRNVVKALFMSPNFLYRTEVGDNQTAGAVTTLTSYELASSLSYMLWDSPPDDALLALAAQNKLRDPAALTAQAKRLMAVADKAPTALHSFLQQYLSIEGLPDTKKDPVYGMFDAQTAADLMEENRLFLNSVMFDQGGDHSFKTLLTAQYGFVSSRTAPIYGINNVSGTNLVKTPFDGTQRRGLLTLGSFMAAHADPDATSLVTRGRFIREQVLCSGVPDPKPGDAVFDPTKITPDMTGREKFTAHSVNPACATCHTLFDAIGFAMENYDPIGRYRTTDHNKPIDPSGSIPLPAGGQLAFKNFVEMVDNLAKTPEVYSCFSAQYLSYATGRGRDQVAACEKQLVADQFVNSGYKLDNLILAVVNSPSFIARKN